LLGIILGTARRYILLGHHLEVLLLLLELLDPPLLSQLVFLALQEILLALEKV
jgi:hypothetical protein